MSVKIVDFKIRQSLDGKPFFALVLQGGIEMVKSAAGNTYLTAKTASMPTTFNEITCKALVGSEMPGTIKRVECEPYNFTIEETGEVIRLTHKYEYVDEETPVVQDFTKMYQHSSNGVSVNG